MMATCYFKDCNKFGSYRCSNCKVALYCSKEHQKADWKNNHKPLCKVTTTPKITPQVTTPKDDEDEDVATVTWWYKDDEPFFPSEEECAKHLPAYPYGEDITKSSFIQIAWEIPSLGFIWYIHSYSPRTKVFFGFTNLDDWKQAEWGDISYNDLKTAFYINLSSLESMCPCPYTFRRGPVMIKDIPFNAEHLCRLL